MPAAAIAQTGCNGLTSPLTTQLTISGSTCSWIGPLIISGTGSLTLQGSTLVLSNEVNYTKVFLIQKNINITEVNTTPGYIGLNGSANLNVEGNSSVTTFGLGLNQSSTLSIAGSSSLDVANNVYLQFSSKLLLNVTQSVPGTLSLFDSSQLSVDGSRLQSSNVILGAVSTVNFSDGASVTLGGAMTEPFYAGSISIVSSDLNARGNATFDIGGSSVSVTKSIVSISGFLNTAFGGTTTTISQSTVDLINDASASLGDNSSSTSSTSISSATSISATGYSSQASMPRTGGIHTYIFGRQLLSITNSNVSSTLSTSATPFVVQVGTVRHTDYPNSTLSIVGGTVEIVSSWVTSSGVEFYGFQPSSLSVLSVNATSNLSVIGSRLVSGNNGQLGTFGTSALTLAAQGNDNVTQSVVQSEATTQSLQLESESASGTNVLGLNKDTIETGTSAGTVALRSSYLADVERTFIDANATGLIFRAGAFRFVAANSVLNVQNISQSTVFGSNVAVGSFVNTTIANCPSFTCLKTIGTGSYSVSDYLQIHVAGSNSQPVAGATVTATAPRTPFTTYSSVTDQTGWARFLALVQYGNGTRPPNSTPYFIIQGTDGNLVSPQAQLVTTGNLTANLQVFLPSVNFTGAAIVGKAISSITSEYNLVAYSRLIPPAGQYTLGNYIGTQYIPYFYVLSNAFPLSFKTNATSNQIDFSTLGQTGGTFYFVLVYPSNLTQITLGLGVDGNSSIPVTRLSNSTTSYVAFSIPSGAHTVTLAYLPPNGNYQGGVLYPKFFPPATTIAGLLVVLFVGIGFAVLFVRSREKRSLVRVP